MVVCGLPKAKTRVRFPYPAPEEQCVELAQSMLYGQRLDKSRESVYYCFMAELGKKYEKGPRLAPEKKKKILEYIETTLPPDEPRIATPMDPECQVSVVIPAYAERQMILRPLESLAKQKGIKKSEFEVIIVVNNPADSPERMVGDSDDGFVQKVALFNAAVKENQEVLKLVKCIQGEEIDLDMSTEEEQTIRAIRESGLRLFVVDKASAGQTLSQSEANVGGARNRGVAEVVERFYTQAKRNGIISQTDADVRLDENYIATLLRFFKEHSKVVGVTGHNEFELPWGDPLYLKTVFFADLLHQYELLFREARGDKTVKSLREAIHFAGANMASRAFETALIGGVPKHSSGEDLFFSEELSKIGETAWVATLVAHPADRFSIRTAGHGYERVRVKEKMTDEGDMLVLNPHFIELADKMNIQLVDSLQHPPVITEILRDIFTHQGTALITEGELDLLVSKITPDTTLAGFKADPVLYKIMTNVMNRGKKVIGEVPLGVGVEGLKSRLLTGHLIEQFEVAKQQILLEEQRAVEYKRQFIVQLVNLLFAEGLVPPTSEQVLQVILDHRVELAIPAEKLEHVSLETAGIMRVVDTLSHATDREEAIQAMNAEYQIELTAPEQQPTTMSTIELRAMFKVMTS